VWCGPNGIHRCGDDDVESMVEEEERCGVGLMAYTSAAVTVWTRRWWRQRCGPSGGGGASVDLAALKKAQENLAA
jgi:hypothetical protein